MRIAIIDPAAGISGDMTLGALLALGAGEPWIRDLPARLGLNGVEVDVGDVRRCGVVCKQVSFRIPAQPHGRHLQDLIALVEAAPVSGWVRERSVAAFRLIGEAEGRVHGLPPERVHLHEVGAVDAVLDIVGAIEGFERLAVERIHARPVAVGSGWVESTHGRLPVPAPATGILLEGLVVAPAGPVEGEATTPTGAALLRVLADHTAVAGWRPLASGWGAGQRDPAGYPNALRIVLAETAPEAGQVIALAADVDDLSPEYVEPLREAVMASGAIDVQTWTVQMKKGRPGLRVEVLVQPGALDAVRQALFRNSTTAGVRWWATERASLARHDVTVDVAPGVVVRAKALSVPGGAVRVKPEYDDVMAAAALLGQPPIDVARAAQRDAEAKIANVKERG